jgi:hypothetical protein
MMIRAIPAISNAPATMIPIVSAVEIPPVPLEEVLGAATVMGPVLVGVVDVVVVGVSAGITLAGLLAPVALALATAGSRAAESTNATATTNRPRARRAVPGSSGIATNITVVATANDGPGSQHGWADGSRAARGRHAGLRSAALRQALSERRRAGL